MKCQVPYRIIFEIMNDTFVLSPTSTMLPYDPNQCPVCGTCFRNETGRKSHQKQRDHYEVYTEQLSESTPVVDEPNGNNATSSTVPSLALDFISAEESTLR